MIVVQRVCSPFVSVGHSYNLMDVRGRRIVNVETASRNRFAVREASAVPFFHANMYRHLQVKQVRIKVEAIELIRQLTDE